VSVEESRGDLEDPVQGCSDGARGDVSSVTRGAAGGGNRVLRHRFVRAFQGVVVNATDRFLTRTTSLTKPRVRTLI